MASVRAQLHDPEAVLHAVLFYERFETAARANLARSLSALAG